MLLETGKRLKGAFPTAVLYMSVFISVSSVPHILIRLFDAADLSERSALVSAVLQLTFYLTAAIAVLVKNGERLSLHPHRLGTAMLDSVFVFICVRLLTDGIKWIIIGITEEMSVYTPPYGMDGPDFAVALLLLALVPAVCEEAFFRFSMRSMLADLSPMKFAALSAFAVSVFHLSSGWESVLASLVLGFVLGLRYCVNSNMSGVVLAHLLFSSLSLFFSHMIYWPTDCAYISVRAASGGECVFWGFVYVSCSALAAGVRVLLASRKNTADEKLPDTVIG